jgi:molybdopterin-synthase adenylyltransferase
MWPEVFPSWVARYWKGSSGRFATSDVSASVLYNKCQITAAPSSAGSMTLDDRYSRQILFTPIGEAGQRRLAAASVAIVGCGATGSATAALLARAGVGHLRIIDRDYVESSNLQRQPLFDEADALESLPKAIAAQRKLAQLNSAIAIEARVDDLIPGNAGELLRNSELILDGTDNFETRYVLNDYAVSSSIPWIYAAAVGSYCATMNILPGETACLACLFPQPPEAAETCDTAGILNSAAHLASALQSAEAIKLLVGAEENLRRTLLSFDVWKNEQAEVAAGSQRAACRTCGQRDFLHLSGAARPQITLCGRNSVQIHKRGDVLSFAEVSQRLTPHGRVKHNEFVLKFWREPYELTLFPDGRAIIKGTTDTAVARNLYARFIGS